jgi:hypothetical protein
MASGVVSFLDAVATLGGGVVVTLRHGATTLGVGASTVGGVVCCPAMIAVSSLMAQMCLILSVVNFGIIVPPNTLRRLLPLQWRGHVVKYLGLGTWQWVGY